MSSCQGEAGQDDYNPGRSQGSGDSHHHHHHHHGHDHDHDHDSEPALKNSLYGKIDIDHVRAFNEHEPNAAKRVFKAWDQRQDRTKYVESDCDEQLIIFVPFTGMVKLKSIWLLAGPGDAMPDKLKAFINTEDVDFDTVDDCQCTQEWDLVAGQNEAVEYGTRITKFNNVRNLTLYFPSNFGADVTRIQYIGFTGEWTELREAPLVTLYELKPNVSDHKVPGDEQRMHNNIF